MIAITNLGPSGRTEDERFYELRINRDLIVTFTHERSQGLAVCLERAAAAVREKQRTDPVGLEVA